jgi:hypothetical protein
MEICFQHPVELGFRLMDWALSSEPPASTWFVVFQSRPGFRATALLHCVSLVKTLYLCFRFGGWEFGNTQSAAAQDQTATVWFNNRGIHSLPSYLNGLNNAVQRKYAKEILGDDPSEYGK